MANVITMFNSLMPIIFAGVANMIFVKHSLFSFAYYPMDNYKILKDGKRLFGDNKTWKGFFGMIGFTIIFQVLWGWVNILIPYLTHNHFIYQIQENTLQLNIILGSVLGFAYVICELPNSFIKRRLDIQAGKPANNYLKYPFIFIDQADSIIGCVAVIAYYARLTLHQIFIYILLGALSHIIINQLLYFSRLRKNPF